METGAAKTPGVYISQPLMEYLLIVSPDAAVYDKVMEEKKNFYNEYGEKIAITSKPHITVANFIAQERMEETIVRWIQRICGLRHGFDVILNNYSSFPPHTIFIRVQDHVPFKQLARDLKVIDSYVRSYNCPPAHLINRPHLTIARQLSESVYQKAVVDYSQKTFYGSFPVRQLVLLRKASDFYRKVNVFPLQPPDPNAYGGGYQTSLFN